MEHESDGYTSCKGLVKITYGLGSKRTNGDLSNYGIAEIGQNTVKSSGDLWRLVVTQTLVKDHQLTLV